MPIVVGALGIISKTLESSRKFAEFRMPRP